MSPEFFRTSKRILVVLSRYIFLCVSTGSEVCKELKFWGLNLGLMGEKYSLFLSIFSDS